MSPLRGPCRPLYSVGGRFTRQSPSRLWCESPNRGRLDLLLVGWVEPFPCPTGALNRKYPWRVLLGIFGPAHTLSGWPYWASARIPGLVSSTVAPERLVVELQHILRNLPIGSCPRRVLQHVLRMSRVTLSRRVLFATEYLSARVPFLRKLLENLQGDWEVLKYNLPE